MKILRVSKYSGKVHSMNIAVTDEMLERWEDGELIQNVMPHLTPDEREFLISGMTPEEWKEMYAADDPEHEEI